MQHKNLCSGLAHLEILDLQEDPESSTWSTQKQSLEYTNVEQTASYNLPSLKTLKLGHMFTSVPLIKAFGICPNITVLRLDSVFLDTSKLHDISFVDFSYDNQEESLVPQGHNSDVNFQLWITLATLFSKISIWEGLQEFWLKKFREHCASRPMEGLRRMLSS